MPSVIGEALIKVRAQLDQGQIKGETGKIKGLLGGVAAGAALLGVEKFLHGSVEESIKAQKAQEKLSFAYEKFPKIADVSRKSLDALNASIQRKTKFDDEALAVGEATLAQFNLTGTQIKTIIPLVADFAARTGRDIPEASQLLGKAFLGNARALKTVGINFVATGDAAKDFATIQGLLSAKVGGFAEKEGKSLEGRLAIMKNQFDEVKEKVGAALLPVLTKLADIIITITEKFNDLPGPVKKVIGVVAVGLVTFIALGKVMAVLRTATVAFGLASAAAAPAIAAEGAAATAATPALVGMLGPLLAAGAAGVALGLAANKITHSGGFSFLGAPSDDTLRRLDTFGNAQELLIRTLHKLNQEGGEGKEVVRRYREEIDAAVKSGNFEQLIALQRRLGGEFRTVAAQISAARNALHDLQAVSAFRATERGAEAASAAALDAANAAALKGSGQHAGQKDRAQVVHLSDSSAAAVGRHTAAALNGVASNARADVRGRGI